MFRTSYVMRYQKKGKQANKMARLHILCDLSPHKKKKPHTHPEFFSRTVAPTQRMCSLCYSQILSKYSSLNKYSNIPET